MEIMRAIMWVIGVTNLCYGFMDYVMLYSYNLLYLGFRNSLGTWGYRYGFGGEDLSFRVAVSLVVPPGHQMSWV